MSPASAADTEALASLESVRRLIGAAFLAAHMGLHDHARQILAGAAAARPNARYLPVARAYVDLLLGDPEATILGLADISNGSDERAVDALHVIVLAATTGGYNDRARSAAERLRLLAPEGSRSFIDGLPLPPSPTAAS